MKSSDIALVILIAAISFGLSYWIVGAIMHNPSERVEQIQYIQEISSVVEEPDHETFNAYAYNLNEETYRGDCEYGTHWNDKLRLCVKDGSDSDNTEPTPEPNPTPDAE